MRYRTVSTDLHPISAPCQIETAAARGLLDVVGIPGAQRGVWLLDHYALPARWRVNPNITGAPYAFVALGVHLHATFLQPGQFLTELDTSACGIEYRLDREPLLSRQWAPATAGICFTCNAIWNHHHA